MANASDIKKQSFFKQHLMIILEIFFFVVAIGLAFYISVQDFGSVVPITLSMMGFIIARFILRRPFHEAVTLYVALSALNYYYFYCSALTGRNPTDWDLLEGAPATDLERAQKDIVFMILGSVGLLKLYVNRMEGLPLFAKNLNHPILKVTVTFIIYSIFRSLFVLFEGDSFFNAAYYLRTNVEFALLPFILMTSLILKEKQIRMIFKGFLYTLPIVALLGIIEFMIAGSPYEKSFYGGHVFSRATSTLQNPNNLGSYLVTTLGVYIIFFFKNRLNRVERILFWPTMPLGMMCLFMTLSRSSVLSFFVTLTAVFAIILLTSKKEMGRERFRICRNLMVGYTLFLAVSFFILYRYFDLNRAIYDAWELYFEESVVRNARAFALVPTLKLMLSNFFGALFGFSPVNLPAAPDNGFANVLVRSGLVGFMLYVTIFFMSLKLSLSRLLDKKYRYSFLYLIIFYVLLFQAIFSFSAPMNATFPHNMYFWLVIGTLVWLETPFLKDLNRYNTPDTMPELVTQRPKYPENSDNPIIEAAKSLEDAEPYHMDTDEVFYSGQNEIDADAKAPADTAEELPLTDVEQSTDSTEPDTDTKD